MSRHVSEQFTFDDLNMKKPESFPYGTEQRVCDDIKERQEKGYVKYGTTVQDNPLILKQWLQHAYEETLDQAIYLRRAIEEIDGPGSGDLRCESCGRKSSSLIAVLSARGTGQSVCDHCSNVLRNIGWRYLRS